MDKRRERFIEEYLIDLNATQAYIRAGYSARGANASAAKLLANPSIRARVDEQLAARSRRTGVTQDRVVRELARIAFLQAPDVIHAEDATVRADAAPDDLAAIASVRVKTIPTQDGTGVEREVKFADKLKALELLGKHLGMYTDRVIVAEDVPRIVDDIGGAGNA